MRIKTTAAFTDKQAKTPEDEDVPAGREMTVTADRGAELIGFGLAVEIEGAAKKPARKPPAPRKSPTVALAAQTAPSPPPAAPADQVAPAIDQPAQ
jgi:hypothetical protein